jgi:hypothetical protein
MRRSCPFIRKQVVVVDDDNSGRWTAKMKEGGDGDGDD